MTSIRSLPVLIASLMLIGLAGPSSAQTADSVPAPVPQAAPAPLKAVDTASRSLSLSASFSDKGGQILSGLKWRVFRASGDGGDVIKVGESDDPSPKFALPPGSYVVHAAYGLAAVTKHVEIGKSPVQDVVVIAAGGLQVEASIGGKPIPPSQLTARVMLIQPSGERRLIAENVPATNVLRLPEGRYYVECTYGDSNAVVSAEISVAAGKLTDATFHQMAATLTLKLVSQPGGEAIANTAWSVLTPGGDVIRESIGAFPSLILAEGNYTVVARHEGRVYTREFEVKAGQDGDVEVVAR
jgi:hypothetical protein